MLATQILGEIIETYWNVNSILCKYLTASKKEIIETYWNVNFFPDFELSADLAK